MWLPRLSWRQPQRLGLSSTSADGYTNRILNQFEQRGIGVQRTAIGALEHAAGLVGRALSAAEVTGTTLLTPEVLLSMGRDLIREGQSFHLFEVDPLGVPALIRSSWANVYGGYHPSSWQYDLTTSGPTDTVTRRYPASTVLHARGSTEPSRPWQGLGPVNTYLSASKMSTKWMKPMNITSSFSNRENIRR